jgi:hypothetical protein
VVDVDARSGGSDDDREHDQAGNQHASDWYRGVRPIGVTSLPCRWRDTPVASSSPCRPVFRLEPIFGMSYQTATV